MLELQFAFSFLKTIRFRFKGHFIVHFLNKFAKETFIKISFAYYYFIVSNKVYDA